MANELPELKPCPFCGGRAEYVEAWGVQCAECGAGTPCTFYDIDEIWNTRTAPKVKPLVFVEDGDRWLTRRAEGYVITTHTVSPYWGVNDPHGNDLGVYDLLQDAEDAAQKDWLEFLSHHIE